MYPIILVTRRICRLEIAAFLGLGTHSQSLGRLSHISAWTSICSSENSSSCRGCRHENDGREIAWWGLQITAAACVSTCFVCIFRLHQHKSWRKLIVRCSDRKRSVALTDFGGRIIRRGGLTTEVRVIIPFPTYVLACRYEGGHCNHVEQSLADCSMNDNEVYKLQ